MWLIFQKQFSKKGVLFLSSDDGFLGGREDKGILQHETRAAGGEAWCGLVVVGSLSF